MGQHRGTARAAHDTRLLREDIIADALAAYDDWHDYNAEPSAEDISNAAEDAMAEGLDWSREEIRAALKKEMAARYAEHKARE